VIRPRQSRTLLALFVFLYSFSLFFPETKAGCSGKKKQKKGAVLLAAWFT